MVRESGAARVVILTGSELRHDFFRKAVSLAEGIAVVRSYAEGLEGTLRATIDPAGPGSDLQLRHLALRDRCERDFFGPFVRFAPDRSNRLSIPRGAINEPRVVSEIDALEPDLILAFGPSIVREPLLSRHVGRFVNVHLGLSPYYFGSGTNFWPLVNSEPEFVGATFMHIDAGIDTGAILHQIRARIYPEDGPHQIGNRLIADMVSATIHLVTHRGDLGPGVKLVRPPSARTYRKRDFTSEAVEELYANFRAGLAKRYESECRSRIALAPIHEHPMFAGWNP